MFATTTTRTSSSLRRLRSCVFCRAVAVYRMRDIFQDLIVAAISDLLDDDDNAAVAPVFFVARRFL